MPENSRPHAIGVLLTSFLSAQPGLSLRVSASLAKPVAQAPLDLNPFIYSWPNKTLPRKLYSRFKVRHNMVFPRMAPRPHLHLCVLSSVCPFGALSSDFVFCVACLS